MQSKLYQEAVDLTFQDISESNFQFKLLHYVEMLKLTRYMKLDNASEKDHNFPEWILNVGHGKPLFAGDNQQVHPLCLSHWAEVQVQIHLTHWVDG